MDGGVLGRNIGIGRGVSIRGRVCQCPTMARGMCHFAPTRGFMHNEHDRVQMVGHDNEFIQFNVAKMIGQGGPRRSDDFADFVQPHLIIQNLAK